MSVAELAEEVGVSKRTIYQLEKPEGSRRGDILTWIKIANALNTSVDALTAHLLEAATSGKA